MGAILAIVCGVVCGIVAATPLLRELGKDEVDLGKGFGSVIVAFLAIQLAMFVVLRLRRGLLAPFGVSAALVFLVCVVVAVIRRGNS